MFSDEKVCTMTLILRTGTAVQYW